MKIPDEMLPDCPVCKIKLTKHLPLDFLGKQFASCKRCHRMFPIAKVWYGKEPTYEVSNSHEYEV